ncbi:MAG: hypothetical protein ACOCQD_01835 [archaeon]
MVIGIIAGLVTLILSVVFIFAMLEAVKLIILVIIFFPMVGIFKNYIGDYLLEMEETYSWGLAIGVSLIVSYVLYSNFLLLMVGGVFLFIVYFILTRYGLGSFTKMDGIVDLIKRKKGGK